MKKLILLLLAFVSAYSAAQDFAPIGAVWYYNQGTVNLNYQTYKTFESVKDTVINGQACSKIIESIENEEQNIQYMFSRNDSVFFFENISFHLLYDFGAEKGDTIVLDHFFANVEGGKLLMIIDSTSTIEINGITKKLQYISCGDGLVIGFGGPIIKDIGSADYMFPTLDNTLNGSLRCYQDNYLGLFKNPYYGVWNKECDYISTSIRNITEESDNIVVPNPVSNSFVIKKLKSVSNYNLTDLHGKVLKSGQIEPEQEINISGFNKGIYFLQIDSGTEKQIKKIIKN